jgi:C4-type Zn-finger protein
MLDRKFVLAIKRTGKHSCPSCQHTRTKNKRDTPLSVTVKSDCVVYFCHHCNIKGAEFYEEYQRQRPKVRKQEGNQPKDPHRFTNRIRTRTVW